MTLDGKELADRADIVLKALAKARDGATSRMVWLTVNIGCEMNLRTVEQALAWLEHRGAVRADRERPVTWSLTSKGIERLRRIALPVREMQRSGRILGPGGWRPDPASVVPGLHHPVPGTGEDSGEADALVHDLGGYGVIQQLQLGFQRDDLLLEGLVLR